MLGDFEGPWGTPYMYLATGPDPIKHISFYKESVFFRTSRARRSSDTTHGCRNDILLPPKPSKARSDLCLAKDVVSYKYIVT